MLLPFGLHTRNENVLLTTTVMWMRRAWFHFLYQLWPLTLTSIRFNVPFYNTKIRAPALYSKQFYFLCISLYNER